MTKQAPTTAAKANRTLSTKPPEFGVECHHRQRNPDEHESQHERQSLWSLAPQDGIERCEREEKRSDLAEKVFDALAQTNVMSGRLHDPNCSTKQPDRHRFAA